MSAEQDFMNCPKTLYPTVVQTIDSVTPDSHAWPYPKTVVCGQCVTLTPLRLVRTFPITRASSNGRCNTIWYKAVFKGGVYETRETIWVFGGAETRRVASLEGRADAA